MAVDIVKKKKKEIGCFIEDAGPLITCEASTLTRELDFSCKLLHTRLTMRTFCHSSKEGKDQESIQPGTAPDPGHHMVK